jgi:hypothetical protein
LATSTQRPWGSTETKGGPSPPEETAFWKVRAPVEASME